MDQVNAIFSFDVGLEQVSTYSEPEQINLPDATELVPGESSFARELVALLYPPSIEQALLDSLRPELDDRRILNPVEFHAALERCHTMIEERIIQDPTNPHCEVLRDALDELGQELELRGMLMTYRHLLHQA